MNHNIAHSIAVCLAALALPSMVACSSQDEYFPNPDDGLQTIFTLDLGDAGLGETRATPADGEYDPGSGLENFIDLPRADFRCYLFGKDSRFISSTEIVSILRLDPVGKTYAVRCRLQDTDAVKDALSNGCRFMFLANWGRYPEATPGMTIGQLCSDASAEFVFSEDMTRLSDGNLIPMYGVKAFDNGVNDFKDNKEISDIGDLHLLRAYAKVEVNVSLDEFVNDVTVTSVSLTHGSGKGYKAPAGVESEEDYVHGSWSKDYTPVNIPADAADTGELTVPMTREETGNVWHGLVFVPEYRNLDVQGVPLHEDERSRIRVCYTVADDEEVEGYVDFRYPDNPPSGATAGEHFDIARNNWYRFNITAKEKETVWKVDVLPYTGVELDPDFGILHNEISRSRKKSPAD